MLALRTLRAPALRALPRVSASRVVAARAFSSTQRVRAVPAGFSGLDSIPGRVENVGTPAKVKETGGKLYASADEAVKDIQSGSLVLSAGFGLCGTAETLITAIVDRPDIKDLTVVSNNAGNVGAGGLCELRWGASRQRG